MSARLRFDRHELAGAFGDIGTDLPLLVGLCVTAPQGGLEAASVFTVFGALQIVTGLVYGIPMPVQPLKAMAAIMLTRHLPAGQLLGAGLVIGAVMLALALSGLLARIAQLVPKIVVRGIQLGLGLSLAKLALGEYVFTDGGPGVALAIGGLLLYLALSRQKRVPAPLVIIGLGVVYAVLRHSEILRGFTAFGLHLPSLRVPTREDVRLGALALALPQLALSLGNSVLATTRATQDLFPGRAVGVRKIGITYALMNLVGPLFGGVPVCHGCGGLVGFYNFGARTGGAPVIYGSLYLVLGMFFAPGLADLVRLFPMPILGVVLFLEALALMALVRDALDEPGGVVVALVVAAAIVAMPSGYVVGLVGGTLLAYGAKAGYFWHTRQNTVPRPESTILVSAAAHDGHGSPPRP